MTLDERVAVAAVLSSSDDPDVFERDVSYTLASKQALNFSAPVNGELWDE